MELSILNLKLKNKLVSIFLQNRRSYIFITVFSFLVLTIVLYLIPEKQKLYVDENTHYAQIASFYLGNFKQDSRLTTLPGYHALMAIIGIICNTTTISFFRLTSAFTASLTIGFFFKLDAKINGKFNLEKTSMFALFPLTFPSFLLIYTDTLSLLLFIVSLYAGLKNKYQLSAVLGILNLLVRQNTFFWYLFSYLLIFMSHYPNLTVNDFKSYLRKSWLFVVGVIIFILFVFLNKGVAIGDKNMHPLGTINVGNVFYLLFLTGVLIFPLTKIEFKKPGVKYCSFVAIMFILYWLCFKVTHPYNLFGVGFFLRNDILHYATVNSFTKVLFFIPIAAGIHTFFNFYNVNKRIFFLTTAFGVLSLLPSWLIEQRYYFVHFTLLLLYGFKKESLKYSWAICLYAALSIFFVYGIFTDLFFL